MKTIQIWQYFLIIFSLGLTLGCNCDKKNSTIKDTKKEIINVGPRFRLNDLLLLYESDPSEFESIVMQKGYRLTSSVTEGESIRHLYKYLKDESINGSRYDISLKYPRLMSNGSKRIDWIFLNIEPNSSIDTIYINRKREAERLGFRFWNSNAEDGITNYSYHRDTGNILLDFSSRKIPNSDITMYSTSIYGEWPN